MSTSYQPAAYTSRLSPGTPRSKGSSVTLSSTIGGGITWSSPDDSAPAHNSFPADPQNHPRQKSLKDLRSLQECVQFIQDWKLQVDRVCKGDGDDPDEGTSVRGKTSSDRRTERSLEESRKLILEWANELRHVDKLLKDSPWESEAEKVESKDSSDAAQLRIMEWAKELQEILEKCGVHSNELGKVLRYLGLKKQRLAKILPLVEFITWSLLKQDSTKLIPQLWLLAKQKTWKAGIPRYIPSSVWSWICSAADDVVLDPMTNHPWLQLSDDQRRVQEAMCESDPPYSSQRFDTWTCVLGWEGYNSGRHYWEVDIANNGYWRVGVTTADSKRHGRFPMTPRQGYWVLWRSTHQFYACTKPEMPLPTSLIPRRVGIYLDYEEGQISFYNAETRSHIFTFNGSFRGKLYPLFAPLDGRTLMTITPQPQKTATALLEMF
ncbi:zinc-binding protein A33 [Sphaeramia orbicularis]|uniref:zinc-binding protein A33 n=1 Tax=Sphaeramia orbicularis TaxID=375764 RepID=UPI00117D1D0E|nr:zinc-binding protein A33-like [Sphaeramia orbicularis]